MRGSGSTLQVTLLLTMLLNQEVLSHDVNWEDIYKAMNRLDDKFINLRSSCPWVFLNHTHTSLFFRNGSCLDLDRITPQRAAFSASGRCQPIFNERLSCNQHAAVGYTCIHNYRRDINMLKRNGQGDPYIGTPITSLVDAHATLSEPMLPEVRPGFQISGVDTVNVAKPGDTHPNFNNFIDQRPILPLQSRTPTFGFLFSRYLLNNNAQLKPQFQTYRPVLPRTLPETLSSTRRVMFDDANRR